MCKDIVKEYEKYDKKTKDESGRILQSNKFKKYTHRSLATGEQIEVDIGYERFLGPEMFFHPVQYLFLTFLGIYSPRLESPFR